MIAYEELQKALARWKARRSGAAEGSEAALEAASPHYQNRDNTGELDLADADVSDATDDLQYASDGVPEARDGASRSAPQAAEDAAPEASSDSTEDPSQDRSGELWPTESTRPGPSS